MRKVCSRFARSEADIDDAEQDAWLAAWESRATFRGTGSAQSFVAGVAFRRCLTTYRDSRRAKRCAPLVDITDEAVANTVVAPDDKPDELLRRSEDRALVNEALAALDRGDAVLLLLRTEDVDAPEAAKLLGSTKTAVQADTARAWRRVRRLLDVTPRRAA